MSTFRKIYHIFIIITIFRTPAPSPNQIIPNRLLLKKIETPKITEGSIKKNSKGFKLHKTNYNFFGLNLDRYADSPLPPPGSN